MGKKIKCLVWDLDNTLWDGTLIEGDDVALKEGVRAIIEELDRRGILQSVASRNEYDDAWPVLESLGLAEYFLYPQINWGSKSQSVKNIAGSLNFGLDAIAFIDDRPDELEEVTFSCPDVLAINAGDYKNIPNMEEFRPRFVTEDSRQRRQMYLADIERKAQETGFEGSNEDFLRSLDMKLTISRVREGDLERVEELTLRTNQLNSTGVTYDYEELRRFIHSERHVFLIAGLEDKFGTYGKIGLVLAEDTGKELDIKLLLMSCRVMTRGIGSAMLVHLIRLAHERGKELTADFKNTGRNRIMHITYKFMGFQEDGAEIDGVQKLRYAGGLREYPDYLELQ